MTRNGIVARFLLLSIKLGRVAGTTMPHGYEFGIEEEYFLADAQTGASPAAAAADRFHIAAAQVHKGAEHELLKGQLEIATPPMTRAMDARDHLESTRRALAKLATRYDLFLFAAGSHPLGSFEQQETTENDRYRKLEEQFGIIAHRSLCCAMHVHVTTPSATDRVNVMNRLVPFLPLLLALSASSPFWNGEPGGLRCTRLAVFSEWPRMGLPEIFASEADFHRFTKYLVDAGHLENSSFIWWLIRPSNKFPTLELRICDSCTRAEDAVAIASFYRCLVRAVVRRPIISDGYGPLHRAITAENIWQAQRLGVRAKFIDAATGAVSPLADILEAALALVAEDADALDCHDWIPRVRAIAADGSSADRQLAVFAEAEAGGASLSDSLRTVVRHLAAESLI